jgi:hypothetical protein
VLPAGNSACACMPTPQIAAIALQESSVALHPAPVVKLERHSQLADPPPSKQQEVVHEETTVSPHPWPPSARPGKHEPFGTHSQEQLEKHESTVIGASMQHITAPVA